MVKRIYFSYLVVKGLMLSCASPVGETAVRRIQFQDSGHVGSERLSLPSLAASLWEQLD